MLSRPFFQGEELPAPAVEPGRGQVRIRLSEWFPSHGYLLTLVSVQHRAPEGLNSTGNLSLNIETRQAVGIGLIWRLDSEILVTGLTAGNYYLKLVRYDPDVLTSLHPFGNPRLPVDQQVTVQ